MHGLFSLHENRLSLLDVFAPPQGGRTPIITLYGLKQEAMASCAPAVHRGIRAMPAPLPHWPIVASGTVSVETPRGNHLVV